MASSFQLSGGLKGLNGILRAITRGQNAMANHRAVVASVLGRLVQAFQGNFRVLDQTKSKYGHNFYNREGIQRTRAELGTGNTGRVVVASLQMAHKYTGGQVSAKNAKMLSIPISEEARRRAVSPSLWATPRLFLIKSRRDNLILAERTGKGKNAGIIPHFLLRKSVLHIPRPYVIPDERILQLAVAQGLEDVDVFN